jgi:hypothetical protein
MGCRARRVDAPRSQVFLLWPGARNTSLEKVDLSFVLGLGLAFTIGSLVQAYLTRRNLKLREKSAPGSRPSPSPPVCVRKPCIADF